MSTNISPTDAIDLDDETVRRYNLPENRTTTLKVDTSENGYSAEWEVTDEFSVEDYEEFLREFDSWPETGEVIASIKSKDERYRGLLDEVADSEGYPNKCTYLRAEADEFDLEWKSGSYTNKVVFNSVSDKKHLLREAFDNFAEIYDDKLLDRPYKSALKEGEQVIDRDCDFHSEEASVGF